MPTAKMGDKINLDRKEFLELKSKGEKIKIRIANADYYYEGKHFLQKPDGEWLVTSCVRINNGGECDNCLRYFEIRNQIKEAKEKGDEKKAKELDKKGRKVKANTSFYYPVIDRDTGLAGIFKTTLTIRLKLEEKKENGIKVLESDWIVRRTEKPGSEYYTLDRVDSADTPKLTEEEEEELVKAQSINLADIVGGKKSSVNFESDSNGEKTDDPDLPF